MAQNNIFYTFDEGIIPGGMRTKTEIKMLICYIFRAVKKPLSKELVVSAILEKALANYFETCSCFDDLVKLGNLKKSEKGEKLFELTKDGMMIADQLENNLAYSVKEKAYACTLELLEKQRIEKENKVTITQTENGCYVNCSISGGDMNLMNFQLYVPDINQARLVRKNFHKSPETVYKVMVALMTRNKDLIDEALSNIGSLL